VRVTTRGPGVEEASRWSPAGIFGAGSPDAAAILQLFFKKIHIFKQYKHILANISVEKRVLCLNKVC